MSTLREVGTGKTISGPDLLVELSRLRRRVTPDLQVIADSLAYLIVAVDHLLQHAHDYEPVEH